MGEKDRCLKCKFFDLVSDTSGFCERYPPFVVWNGVDTNTEWPFVHINNSCGEFKENHYDKKESES